MKSDCAEKLICLIFQSDHRCRTLPPKIYISFFQKSCYPPASRLDQEGRFAVVTNVGVGCGGRVGLQRGFHHADGQRDTHGEIVWSWPPGAEVKSAPRRARGRRGQESRSPGRSRISRNAIAQGGPGCLGRTCGSCPVHFFRTGAMGAASSRPSLRPLFAEGETNCRPRARDAPREGDVMPAGRNEGNERAVFSNVVPDERARSGIHTPQRML
jgi:hypothetical protein